MLILTISFMVGAGMEKTRLAPLHRASLAYCCLTLRHNSNLKIVGYVEISALIIQLKLCFKKAKSGVKPLDYFLLIYFTEEDLRLLN